MSAVVPARPQRVLLTTGVLLWSGRCPPWSMAAWTGCSVVATVAARDVRAVEPSYAALNRSRCRATGPKYVRSKNRTQWAEIPAGSSAERNHAVLRRRRRGPPRFRKSPGSTRRHPPRQLATPGEHRRRIENEQHANLNPVRCVVGAGGARNGPTRGQPSSLSSGGWARDLTLLDGCA